MDLPEFTAALFLAFGTNPLAAIAITVGVTEAAQKAFAWLDGPVIVPAFAISTGAALGTAYAIAGQVTVTGFTNGILSGTAYGALAGLSGVIGLNAINAIADHVTPKQRPVAFASTAGQWAVDYVTGLVPRSKLTAALDVIAPILSRFVDAQLTPELQADITLRIHRALSSAGLLPVRDFPE